MNTIKHIKKCILEHSQRIPPRQVFKFNLIPDKLTNSKNPQTVISQAIKISSKFFPYWKNSIHSQFNIYFLMQAA